MPYTTPDVVHLPFTPELHALHVLLPDGHSGSEKDEWTRVFFSVLLLCHDTRMLRPDFLVMALTLAVRVSSTYGRVK